MVAHYIDPLYYRSIHCNEQYARIYTVYTPINLSYLSMFQQHLLTAPAAHVPDPDRLIQ